MLLFGLGIELMLLLFYVVMVVGLAAKTRRGPGALNGSARRVKPRQR
ncbi:MAG TPA: hypothetical protein VFB44_07475 [Thermoleophilaceae bacterium]|nr:hypothetical protein [Thermoleophilaceae bacterium]